MNVNKLLPLPATNVQFSWKHHKFVPLTSGCYALTTFAGDVLYVGLSENLQRRFAEHRDSPEKCKATTLGSAFWFYYLTCVPNQVNQIERAWLNMSISVDGQLPVLNKINSPVH